MADISKIKLPNGDEYTVKDPNAQKVRVTGSSYNPNADAYVGGSGARKYLRVALPDSSATIWTMVYMEVSIRGMFASGYGGKVLINGYHTSTSPYSWAGFNYTLIGNLPSSVIVYGSDGKYIYITLDSAYQTASLDKVLVGDTAIGVDLSRFSLTFVDELPATYQTATRVPPDPGAIQKAEGGSVNGDLTRVVNNNTIVPANSTSFFQSPIPKYLWHDVLAFCRAAVPKYYTTDNGATWTEKTLEKNLFAQKEVWTPATVLSSTITGSRWVWLNGYFYASSVSWLVLGIMYKNPVSHFDVLLETSADSGSTWTTLCDVKNVYYNQTPIWIKFSGTCQNSIRLTITNNSASASGASLGLCSIKLLTHRWGDQGKGSEYEHPIAWDGSGNVTPIPGGSIAATTVNGHTVNADVPSGAKFTDTTYTGTSPISVNNSNQISITTASTSAYGATKLSTATNSTATDLAATPSAVKTAYDLASTANDTAIVALSGVNGTMIYDHTYTISNGVATFTPHVYLKGAEVTTNYNKSCFGWKYRLINGSEVALTTNNDRGCTVTITNLGYGGHVIGTFTPS